MQQQQYERFARGPAFEPEATPDFTPSMKENNQVIKQSYQVQQQGLQDNIKMELLDAKFEGQGLNALAGLSETVAKKVVENQQKENKRQQEEGLRDAYINGVSPEVQAAFDEQMSALNDSAASTERALNDAVDNNAIPWKLARELSDMSPHKRVGYAKGILRQLGQQYPQMLQTELLDALEANPTMSQQEKNARLAAYRYNWMKTSGLTEFNTALLNEELFPAMQEAEARVINQWAASEERKQREQLGEDANMLMQQPFSQSNWDTASELYRAAGFSRAQARRQALSQIDNLETLNQWAGLISFDGKTTLGEKFSKDFTNRRNAILNEQLGVYEFNEKSLNLASKQYADPFIELWRTGQEQPTDYDIEQIKQQSIRYFGRYDPRLDQFTSVTVDAERDRAIRKDLDARIKAGDDISTLLQNPNIPADIREEYTTKNKVNVGEDGKSVKKDTYSDQLEQAIYRNIGGTSTPLESKKQTAGALLAVDAAQAMYVQRRAELLAGGGENMTPALASQQAYNEILELIQQGNDPDNLNSSNPFAFHQVKGYYNMVYPGGSTAAADRQRAAVDSQTNRANVDNIFRANGTRPREHLLDRSQLIPRGLLQQYVQQSGEWTYEPPEIAKYISDEYYGGRISPWQIMQRQAAFQLGEEGTLPPSILRSETMSPGAKALLYRAPSYNRIGRAYRIMNAEGFDPSLVPGHYGGMVVEAAQANNIDPALLAGLLEQESGWDPGAVSPAGAQGLGQFMPETAKEFGVNRTDPKSSIDGAARYLRYLIDYFGGDQTLAVYAYNGGMGNIERYGGPIPGNKENEEYYGLVMDRATRYGYQGYVPGLNPAIQQ